MVISKNLSSLVISDSSAVIFNSLAPQFHKVPLGAVNSIEKIAEDNSIIKEVLLCKNIIFENSASEKVFIHKIKNHIDDFFKIPNTLYISFTQRCNISCTHCVFPVRNHKPEKISQYSIYSMISNWIEYVFTVDNKYAGDLFLIPYGGDPTLKKDVLFDLLKHIEHLRGIDIRYRKISVYIPTNGLLLNFNDLNELSQYSFVHICFGLDGTSDIHCGVKKVSLKEYLKVTQNIEFALSRDLTVSVSTLATLECMSDMTNFLSLLDSLGVKYFGLNYIRNANLEIDTYLKVLSEMYLYSFDRLLNSEYQLMRRIKLLKEHTPIFLDCPCYGKQFTLFPDNTVGICPFESTGMVDLNSFIESSINQKALIQNTWLKVYFEKVLAHDFFGGGCNWAHAQNNKNYEFDVKVNKTIYSLIIKKMFL